MVTRATQLGWRGEEVAQRFLERRGLVFIERHFRTRYGEIDLIMRDGETTAFIEVKTRRDRSFGAPEESVGEKKLDKLAMAAAEYQRRYPEVGQYRIDLVIIEMSGSGYSTRHIRDLC
ncbi:MAG: YraN family protein [Candidatus Kerfeldbacteria bacterium]